MNEQKLVVCIMGQNCEKFIRMCLESVKDADAIVYCDGGSEDCSTQIAEGRDAIIIKNNYNQEDKGMNGKQRNFYLKHLKEHYKDWWALCLDADEVVEDLSKIKEFIQTTENKVFSVKMRHFIGDLAHEDSTQTTHWVPHRLFKISEVEGYPEVEHPVLESEYPAICTACTTIWHLAYIPNLFEYKKKYENHLKKSNMHTPKYLHDWYYSHLFGTYPRKEFCTDQIPSVILKEFGIEKDEIYFENRRNLDVKHFVDAIYLRDWLKDKVNTPRVIDFGCGMGLRVWAMNKVGLDTWGIELSKYAVDNSFYPEKISQGDITKYEKVDLTFFNLSMAYDVLEHLRYEDLSKGIDTLINHTNKYILVSIPFKGTPNCEMDNTHIIKEDKEWWISQFEIKGLKLIKTPEHFLYRDQILIFEK